MTGAADSRDALRATPAAAQPPLTSLLLGSGRLSLRGLPPWLQRPYALLVGVLVVITALQVLAQAGAVAGTLAALCSLVLAYVSICLGLYALASGAMDLPFLPRRCLLLVYATLDLALMQGPYGLGPSATVLLAGAGVLAILPWERLPPWTVGPAFALPPLLGLTETLLTDGYDEVGPGRGMAQVRNNPLTFFTEVVTDFSALPRALASVGVLLLLAQLVAPVGRVLARPLAGPPRRAATALAVSGVLVVTLLLGAPLHVLGAATAEQLAADTLAEWLVAAAAVALLLLAALRADLRPSALGGVAVVVCCLTLPEVLTVVLRTPALFARGEASSFAAMACVLAVVPALAVVRAACSRSRATTQDAVTAVALAAAGSLLVLALLRAEFVTPIGEPGDLFYRLNQVRLFWWLLPIAVAWFVLAPVASRGRGAIVGALAGMTFATGVWSTGLRTVSGLVEVVPGGDVLGRAANSPGASLPTLQLLLVVGSALLLSRVPVAPAIRTRIVALNLGVLVLTYAPLLRGIGGLLPTAATVGLLLPLLWELLRRGGELNEEPQRRFKTTWFLGNVALTAPVILYLTLQDSGGEAGPPPDVAPEPVTLGTYETGDLLRDLAGIDTTYLPSALSGQLLSVVGPFVLLVGVLVLSSSGAAPGLTRTTSSGRSWLVGAFAAPLTLVLLAVPMLLDRDLLPTAAGSFIDPAPDRDSDGNLLAPEPAPLPEVEPSPEPLRSLPPGAVPTCTDALSVVEQWTPEERTFMLSSYAGRGATVLAGPPSEPGRRLGLRYTSADAAGPVYATTVYEVGTGFVDVEGGTDALGDFRLLLSFNEGGPATCRSLE